MRRRQRVKLKINWAEIFQRNVLEELQLPLKITYGSFKSAFSEGF